MKEDMFETIASATKPCVLYGVVGSTTKDWEVLKDGETWTNGLSSEQECLDEIKDSKARGNDGKWSYREFVSTLSVGKIVEL